MKKGVIELGVIIGVALAIVFAYLFMGVVVPSTFNSVYSTKGVAYANESFTANTTYAANGTGNTTLYTLAHKPLVTESTKVSNSTWEAACVLTKDTNYSVDNAAGTITLTTYNTSLCGTAWEVSYQNLIIPSGNFSAYANAEATYNIVPIFFSILLVIAAACAAIILLKAVGIL